MRIFIFTLVFSISAMVSFSSYAEMMDKEALPQKVLANLYKRHPNAFDITARPEKHFNQDLYEIFFKEGEENLIELYRVNGAFFVNAVLIDASELVPPAAYENLKAAFGDYQIKHVILVVNPNGPGEEYDFTVDDAGRIWNVLIDTNGNIISKES